jgi:hypothetical protein
MTPIFSPSLKKSTLLVLTTITLSSMCLPPVWADGKTLQGGVQEQDWLRPTGPSLNRDMLKQKGDPFGEPKDSGGDAFDAPVDAFSPMSGTAAPPPPPFKLNADDQGDFGGQAMPGMEQQIPSGQPAQMSPNQNMLNVPPKQPSNDPDAASPELQVAWDIWHKNVAMQIYQRFDAIAQKFFHGRPLACQVAYTVTRDGRIINVRMLQKSPNIMFNSSLLLVINSMRGNPVLQFPMGSRRGVVEKTATFTRNYGVQGFKHQIGDQERVRQQQMQQNNMGQQMQQGNSMDQMQQMQQMLNSMPH